MVDPPAATERRSTPASLSHRAASHLSAQAPFHKPISAQQQASIRTVYKIRSGSSYSIVPVRFHTPDLPVSVLLRFPASEPAAGFRPARFCRPETPTGLYSRHNRGQCVDFALFLHGVADHSGHNRIVSIRSPFGFIRPPSEVPPTERTPCFLLFRQYPAPSLQFHHKRPYGCSAAFRKSLSAALW